MDSNTDQNVEIRNGPIQEIIGRTPGWITLWGITMVFGFILILLLFALIFRYPDSVKSAIVITTENPPANLMARASGNIQKIFVVDNQRVNPGDLLAIIDNPANYNDVILIRRWTDSIMADTGSYNFPDRQKPLNTSFQLGEIQPTISAYFNHLSDYTYYRKDNPEKQRIEALKQELDRYGELNRELAKQSNILKKEFELIRKQHDRNIALHTSGTISDADLEKSESVLLAKDFGYGESKVLLAHNRLQE